MRLLATGGCLLLLSGLVGCGSDPDLRAAQQPIGAVGPFLLTDQDGRPVSREDLLGKVWVASFVFTRCRTVCPQVSATMARLYEAEENRDDALLVSFSVDPEEDTPEVLKRYATQYGARAPGWRFLTGPEKDMYRVIRESFLLGVEQNTGDSRTPGNEVTHSTRLAVVDRKGNVRAYFDGRQVDDEGHAVNDVPRIVKLIAALARESG
jgi:cytochrome oxidase Cu insertion factor (SCO1/SenC/PrrC family)